MPKKYITPEEFKKLREICRYKIDELEEEICLAEEKAVKCPFPNKVRAAEPEDIFVGNIIWYKQGDNGPFWSIVEVVHEAKGYYKAYTGNDGCVYGLDDAWIEEDEK